MADDTKKEEKKEVPSENTVERDEPLLDRFAGALAEVVFYMAIILAAVLGAVKSQFGKAVVDTAEDFLLWVYGGTPTAYSEVMSRLSRGWDATRRGFRRAGWLLIAHCSVILALHLLGLKLQAVIAFGLLFLLPLVPLVLIQGYFRHVQGTPKKGVSAARPLSIIYLTMVFVNLMYLISSQTRLILPESLSLAYLWITIALMVLLMSSFSILIGRQRNALFRTAVWVGLALGLFALVIHIPLVGGFLQRNLAQAATLSWQEYEVVAPVAFYQEQVTEPAWWQPWKDKTVKLVKSETTVEPAKSETTTESPKPKGSSSILVNRNQAVNASHVVFYAAKVVDETDVLKSETEGFVVLDPKKLRLVEKEEPESQEQKPEKEAVQPKVSEEATSAVVVDQQSVKIITAKLEDDDGLKDGEPEFIGKLTKEWVNTGIILHLRPENWPYTDAATFEGYGKPMTSTDIDRIEVCFAPVTGPEYAAEGAVGTPSVNGRTKKAFGLVHATDLNVQNDVMYARIKEGEPLEVRVEAQRAYYNVAR